jgi:hypothetical protein
MKKDIFYRLVGIFIIAVILLMMMVGFIGCRTVDIAKSKTNTDSTAYKVIKTDSSTYNLVEALYKWGKATEKTYTPGKDTVIVNPITGEVKIIQLPGQVIKEYIYENSEGSNKTEEVKTFSSSDSLIMALIKAQETKDKEVTGIPIWLKISAAIIFLIIIFLAGFVFYQKVKR